MKKLFKNSWLFLLLILGVGTVVYCDSLVDLNVTGGISANDNPVTLNNGLLIKGANTEFRNASYKVFMSTVSGGTEYETFTPSSATFNQNVVVNGNTALGDTNSDTTTINGEVTVSSDTAITGTLAVNNSANTDYTIKATGNSTYGSLAWYSADGIIKGILSDDTTQAGVASIGNVDFRILASGTGDIYAQLDSNSNFNFSTGQGVHVGTVTSSGVAQFRGLTVAPGYSTSVITIGTTTATPSTVTDSVVLYSTHPAGGQTELYVLDEGGISTLLSPHNNSGEWIFYSVNQKGSVMAINMMDVIHEVEKLSGKKLIYNRREDIE